MQNIVLIFPRAKRCLAIALCGWLAFEAASQQTPANGQGSSPEVKLKPGVRYYGRSGLGYTAADLAANAECVDISYGTTLTREDVSLLSTLENVTEISMGGNLYDEFVTVEGSLSGLANMKRLQSVFLCKQEMCDDDLEFVAHLPEIRYLEFLGDTDGFHKEGPTVTDRCAEFIGRASTLWELRIDESDKLTDRFISQISQDLTNLEHLGVGSHLFTDRSLQMLADRCVKLTSLNIWSRQFTDDGVGYLMNTKQLEMLSLYSESITGACAISVGGLQHLRQLTLSVPSIEDEGVRALAKLPKLEILSLKGPRLTDEQLAMFANHPTLNSAFLNGSGLSEERVLEVVNTFPKLRHLSVGSSNRSLQLAIDRLLGERENMTTIRTPMPGGDPKLNSALHDGNP